MAKKPGNDKKKVRVGFIGSGGIMGGHAQRLAECGADLVALADPSSDACKRIKDRVPQYKDADEFEDWQEMLKKSDLDAVEIGSPHTLHYEQICAALDKGLHVLCEKPMTCTSAHARDLIKRVKKAKKVLGISYQRHFQGTYRYLRQLVESGQLGKITYVAALQGQEWLNAVRGTWRQTQKLSGGGQLNDSGSHLLDMFMWTTGLEAEEVSCRSDFFDTEVDINSAVNVTFTNGALGTISVIGSAPTGFYEDFTIVGTEGIAYYRNGKITYQLGKAGPVLELTKGLDWMNPDSNFVGAINGECEIGCPPIIGLRVIELTEAAWRSHDANGKPVKVERGS